MAGVNPYMNLGPSPTPSADVNPYMNLGPSPTPARPSPAAEPAPETNPYMHLGDPKKLTHTIDEAQHKLTAPLDQRLRDAALEATKLTGHVVEPIDAVVNAGTRFVQGGLTALGEGHPERALSEAGDAFMHPDKTTHYQQGAEKFTHADALKVAHPSQWYDYARNAAVDFGADTLMNPLTYTPLRAIGLAERGVVGAARLLPGAKAVGGAVEKATGPVRSMIDPTHGVAAAIGSEKAGEFQALQAEAKKWAADHVAAHPNEGPVEAKARLDLQEELAKTYVRNKAPELFGFNAPHYEKRAFEAAPPTTHGPQAPPPGAPQVNYKTMTQTGGRDGRGIPPPNVIDKRDIGGPTMEEQGLPHPLEPTAPERTVDEAAGNANREALLAKAHEQKAKQPLTAHGRATLTPGFVPGEVSATVRDYLRSDPQAQHLLERWEALELPKAVQHALYERNMQPAKTPLGRFSVKVADSLKDVMFLNIIPHTKNELFMAAQSPGGARVVFDGLMRYAQSGTAAWKQLTEHLHNIGAADTWLLQREGLFRKIAVLTGADSPSMVGKVTSFPARALDWWSKAAQDHLWRLDNSLRQAMYLQQKRLHPDWGDGEIAGYIQAHMFNYGQQSDLAQKLYNAGAPFAHWRIESPLRQMRGLVENPAGTGRLMRGEQDINNQIPDRAGWKINFATPGDELQKIVNPVTALPYAAATMGEEWREPLRLATGRDSFQEFAHDPVHDLLEEGITRFAPGGNTIVDAYENPFHSKADFLAREGLQVFGGYAQNNTSLYERFHRIYLSMPGMSAERAKDMARAAVGRLRSGLGK